MKYFRRAVERYCMNHPRFGISRMMMYVSCISGLIYLLLLMLQSQAQSALFYTLMFDPGLILRGQVWRLVTWVFLPTQSLGGMGVFFTLIALYFYYWIGSTLESSWGKGMFTLYYLIGIIAHIIYGFASYYVFKRTFTYIDPVYLNLSMFFAFAMINPDQRILLFFIIPIKIKWMALVNGVFFVYGIFTNIISGLFVEAFFPVIALINFLIICGDELMHIIKTSRKRVQYNTAPGTINFKRAARKVKREMRDKPYRHICAVCGKTDADFPDMEFRYCSMCQGFHCFCKEHIDNHVHFRS